MKAPVGDGCQYPSTPTDHEFGMGREHVACYRLTPKEAVNGEPGESLRASLGLPCEACEPGPPKFSN